MDKLDFKLPILTCPSTNITPIITIVGENCNIKCDYCFYHHKNQAHNEVMSIEVLDLFLKEYLDLFDGEVVFVWHGGEPLLAGIDFFKHIVRIQKERKRKNHEIHNSIQTNGTLITDEWAKFFLDNNWGVGISLDGIEECHNQFRKNNAGIGTFERVIQVINLLNGYGVKPGILQTVPRSSMKYIKDNFNFMTDILKLNFFGVNIYDDVAGVNDILKDESLSNDDYYNLYKEYFDLWLKRNDTDLEIREVEAFVFGILGRMSRCCINSGTCTSFMTVNWDGTVTPACERLVSQCSSIAKNIQNERLIDILNDLKRIEFASKVNSLPEECNICEWKNACYNGCSSIRQGGVQGKYVYCDGQKRLFSYIKKRLDDYNITQ
jgi:uncharacterized protein